MRMLENETLSNDMDSSDEEIDIRKGMKNDE